MPGRTLCGHQKGTARRPPPAPLLVVVVGCVLVGGLGFAAPLRAVFRSGARWLCVSFCFSRALAQMPRVARVCAVAPGWLAPAAVFVRGKVAAGARVARSPLCGSLALPWLSCSRLRR